MDPGFRRDGARHIQNPYSLFVLFVFYSPERRRFAARPERMSNEACQSHRSICPPSIGRLRLILLSHRRGVAQDILTFAVGNDVSAFGFVHFERHLIYALVDKLLCDCLDLEQN
jgi:hypothetical protein